MPPVVNIAAYRFVTLDRLHDRRDQLTSLCEELGLKGTILLSAEGINLFLAGSAEGIGTFLDQLQQDEAFAGLSVKRSLSNTQPFGKMRVKLKREIIPLGVESIAPEKATSPRISPRTLRSWLDEGRDVLLLDVRNAFEIAYGTFTDARTLNIAHFRELPTAVDRLGDDFKQRPVVTFCTGGIRCEKAGPYLEQQGFTEVYQLDGGILNYFEQCGSAHFDGDCFVFDERISLDAQLRPVASA